MRAFWAKKRAKEDPQATPWLGSVPLPAEDSIRRSSSRNQNFSSTTPAPRMRRDESSSRSKTPHPMSSGYLPREVSEVSRPRTTSVTASGRPVKGILKTSKPQEGADDKKPLKTRNSEEPASKSRSRSSSLTNGIKGILKPSKPVVEDDYYPVKPTSGNKGGSLGSKEDASTYHKTGTKAGGKSYPSSKEKDLENTSPPRAAYPERPGQVPPSQLYPAPIAPQPRKPISPQQLEYQQSHPGMQPYYPQPGYPAHPVTYPGMRTDLQRSASHNGYPRHPPVIPHQAPYTPRPTMYPVTPQQPPYPMSPGYNSPWPGQNQEQQQPVMQTNSDRQPDERYVRSTVVRRMVPGKPEDIALNWHFVDPYSKPPNHQRWKFPRLFFDIGMDPRDEVIGIRAFLPGCAYTRPLTEEEKNMPASSHCVVTKMKIYIEDFYKWPILAERAEGLRCIDIFDAVYKTFAVPLTAEDKYDYRPEFLDSCIPAFKQRCKDGPGLTDINEARGLCRVDLLRTQKIFKSISKKGREPAWTLKLDRPVERPQGSSRSQ